MDAAFHIKPFAFERIFSLDAGALPGDEGDLKLEVMALRDEITVLKTESELALLMARTEGFEAGLAQARGERETALLASAEALQDALVTISEGFGTLEEKMGKSAVEVALAAADIMAARSLGLAPAAAINLAIDRVLAQVNRGQELQIRVSPGLVEEMEGLVLLRQNAERRRLNLTVVGDATLDVGDALISWEQGGLALDAAARRTAVRNALDLPSET